MEKIAFGIDFGTTNSIVAAWGSNIQRHEEIPFAFWSRQQRPHPSIVWYGPHDEPIVGHDARANMQSQENSIGHVFIRSVKRELGTNKEIEIVGGVRKSAYEVAAEVFRHLKREAEKSPLIKGNQVGECVVTVPVDFRGEHRRDIRRALERAGLKLKAFLHEPFAAMISHFYDPIAKLQTIRGQRFVVFDWGGGTLDVCLAEVAADGSCVYELAHDGIADRAGDDFDRKIMTLLKNRILQKRGDVKINDLELKGSAKDRFWISAENGKIELSNRSVTTVTVGNFVEVLGKTIDLEERLTRQELEDLIKDEVAAAESCVLRCLERARLTPGLIDRVLLVGGTSNIPAVRAALEKHFGTKVEVAREPDAAIARGAAIVAAEGWQPYNVRSVGVKLSNGDFLEILPAGAPFSAATSRRMVFYCTDPRPGFANFLFSQQSVAGDRTYRSLDNVLCVETKTECEIQSQRDLDRIVADFSVTEDATLVCTALSSSVGKEARCEIHDLCFGVRMN